MIRNREMSTHLHGRLPHELIHEILNNANKAKTKSDLLAVKKKIEYASRVFATVVADFVSSFQRREEKRGKFTYKDPKGMTIRCSLIYNLRKRYRLTPRSLRLILDSFVGECIFQNVTNPETLLKSCIIGFKGGQRHDDILYAIQSDRCDIVKRLIDSNNEDMRSVMKKRCFNLVC